MKTIRARFVLSAILLGVLVVWLLAHRSSHPQKVSSQSRTASDSIPVVKAAVPSAPTRERLREVQAKPLQPKPDIHQASAELVFTDSESPIYSQDLDQNRGWARTFPSDALDWLETSPDSPQRVAVAEIVCPQLAQTNAVAAVKLAEKCLNDTNDAAQHLLGTMAQIWAAQDIQAATDWALAKPGGQLRDLLLQHITSAESKTDPFEAARLVAEQMSPGQFQNEAAVAVVYQWAQRDAAAALAWSESFLAGHLRDRVIKEVENVAATRRGNAPQN